MLLVDTTHTSHTRARTGIQRVVRSLCATPGIDALPICHDPFADTWRLLSASEQANLTAREGAAVRRSARWPLRTRLAGRWRNWSGRPAEPLPAASGLIVPEVFSATVAAALPSLLAQVRGPRVALFHDALPMQLPELTPPGTVARFPRYLRELRQFDGIVTPSVESRKALIGYWQWLGLAGTPPVLVLAHGIERPPSPPPAAMASDRPTVPEILAVGSLEPRKNHLALFDACEALWREGLAFRLRVIGLASPHHSAAAARLAALAAARRPVRYDGPVDDDELERAYATCAFTVYPSRAEGFGLPVAESLVRGKPCVCLGQGAIGEVAAGGGCVMLDRVEPADLAAGLRQLLCDPAERDRLAAAARQRAFGSWTDYARNLHAWMGTLPHR